MLLTTHTDHRPYPLPKSPWVMHQAWNDFLFMHWKVDAAVIRELVPEPLELHLHEGACYLGIIPFNMSDVRPRGTLNVAGISAFAELNVRTYVTYKGRSGVFFLSLDAHNRLAVETARLTYDLPYYKATMRLEREGETLRYSSVRTDRRGAPARWTGHYRPKGGYFFAEPGSLRHWLSERYCLYTVDGTGGVWQTDVHHLPWPMREVEVEIQENTMAEGFGFSLPAGEGFATYSPGVDVVVWAPQRVNP